MQQFKFANILLENNPRSLSYPALYCRSTAPVVFERTRQVWELYGPGSFDFTTYFNALSIMKLGRYTVARGFNLHIEVRGAACTLSQTTADAFSTEPSIVEGISFNVPAADAWVAVDFPLVVDPQAVLVGFQISSEGSTFIRNGYYYLDVEESDMVDVELALATTTFKKEDFIQANIELIRKHIMKGEPGMAAHFKMLVIDNGRTLDAQALSGDGISVLPNPNAGGAGGFTRGMIEAMHLPIPATHVLLMDDDVAVSPEAIKRTYNLLRILRPEYRGALVSGAMLNYEVGEDLWEDLGYMTPDGHFSGVKPTNLRMSLLHDIVMNEQFIPTDEQARQMYAAWWYCVIPTDVIRENGLPLPVFVRCDDAEYGIRCKPRFITMNGICIWHQAFHSRYNAAVERYQTTRNTLIAQATCGFAPDSDFLKELHNNLQIELKKFNYTDAELLLDGFEDFMKGPGFIGAPGVAEECFMRANRNAEKLVSFDELREMTKDIEGFDLDALDCLSIYRDEPRTKAEALVDFVTFNRQRVMTSSSKGVAVIPAEGWEYLAGKIRGRDVIVAIDAYRRRGIVRHRDVGRFNAVMKRYHDDLLEYRRRKAQLEAEYAAARPWLTSEEFWKGYLGVE